jgi:hypothetical protein
VPAPVLGLLCSRGKTSAYLVVQDVITQFGEPQGFTCLIYNADVKNWFKKIRIANTEESDLDLLVELEPR